MGSSRRAQAHFSCFQLDSIEQASRWLDIFHLRVRNGHVPSAGLATTKLVAPVKCKASWKIICSAISSSGTPFAYSDLVKHNLFKLNRSGSDNNLWTVNKRMLPQEIPFAHCMVFSPDSSRLLIAGHNRMIYVVDAGSGELVHALSYRLYRGVAI
ncbi:U3 small nucleolar RNA-associated 4 homolog [Olea europaea subsp. europaea]|uniref:U3 small nucleolar RNA-associated 4 homolog n=1 Tax=Olea europaea subsp. europaea TaxID=158383 RepID=A0A8S0T489_OLEEU|nr:U3 small nucleolar RNA-associated 4 homolog [Olea europaea subsp. europaea]